MFTLAKANHKRVVCYVKAVDYTRHVQFSVQVSLTVVSETDLGSPEPSVLEIPGHFLGRKHCYIMKSF